jgi:phage-related protein
MSEALGVLWEMVQQAGQAVLDFFGISSEGNFDVVRVLIDAIGMAWNNLRTILQPVITLVMGVINAFNQFRTGQIDLPTFIMSILTLVAQAYLTVFNRIIGFVARFGAQMIQRGISSATSFVNNIITRIRQLPGRIYSALINVVSRIRSAIQSWITAAVNKVNELIRNVTSPFTGLAGAISSALSGVVEAITAPFRDAYNAVKPYLDAIKEGAEFLGFAGGPAAGGPAAGGYEISESNGPIDLNITLTHNLENVPDVLSEAAIAELINNSTSSDGFLRAIAESSVFQKYVLRGKNVLVGKANRARGV